MKPITKKERVIQIQKLNISDRAKTLIIELLSEAKSSCHYMVSTYNAYVMSRLNWSKSTLERAKRDLVNAGLLTIIKPDNQRILKKSNIYMFRFIEIDKAVKKERRAEKKANKKCVRKPDTLNILFNNYNCFSTKKKNLSRAAKTDKFSQLDLSNIELAEESLVYSTSDVMIKAKEIVRKYFCLIKTDKINQYVIDEKNISKSDMVSKIDALSYVDLKNIMLKVGDVISTKGIRSMYSFMVNVFFKGILSQDDVEKSKSSKDITSDLGKVSENQGFEARDYDFDELEKLLISNY